MTPCLRRPQQGYALLATLALVLIASSLCLAPCLEGLDRKLAQKNRNEERHSAMQALEAAKARLILLALSNPKTPGALPCPDFLNNGQDNSTCGAYGRLASGRYPYVKAPGSEQSWLNLRPPPTQATRRGGQECLWYALSPSFGNWIDNRRRLSAPPADKPGQGQLNPEHAGDLSYQGEAVIAVLIAPGEALPGQQRQAAHSPSWCTGGGAAHYLETLDTPAHGPGNNADAQGRFADSRTPARRDANSGLCVATQDLAPEADSRIECNNDVILPLTREALMKPLIREVLRRLVAADVRNATNDLLIPSAMPGLRNLLEGRPSARLSDIRQSLALDNQPLNAFDTALFGQGNLRKSTSALGCPESTRMGSARDDRPLWLCANDWYRFIEYDAQDQSLAIRLDLGQSRQFECRARLSNPEVLCQ